MTSQRNIGLLVGLVLIGLTIFDGVVGHSYVTSPTSRSNQKQSMTGCRGPACLGPCDAPASRARSPITIQRGQTINVQWPRNNHAGGFIRIAWAPTSQSDTMSVFDNNVQEISCHERGGCKPDNANDPNGGDSAPADGSFQPCQLSVVVPPHLTDGLWTMQWAWFGGAFSLGDYYSCVDYQISGGASGSRPTPFFVGGDFTYPNQQKCKFFNTDRLHACVNEPCSNPVYPAASEESGAPYGISAGGSSSTTTTSTSTSTTGRQTSTSTTTGRQTSTSTTTGRQTSTSTTGSRTSTTTTGRSSTTTTTTGSAPTPSPTPTPSGNNCAGVSQLSSSTATITSVDTWGTTLRAVIELRVMEDLLPTWYLQINWPSNAVSTRVQNVYNAGALMCESTTPVRHAVLKPAANWAMNLASGTVLTIEIMATNSNMNRQFIQSNTQLKVFRG